MLHALALPASTPVPKVYAAHVFVHASGSVAASGAVFPAVQGAHVTEPAVAYVPALQVMQTAFDEAAAPVVAEAVPALHDEHVAVAAAA